MANCLLPTTKIITNNGIKQLKNLLKNDKILSYNFNTKKKEYKSFKKWDTEPKKIIIIETPQGKVYCSPNHRLYVKTKKGIKLKKAKYLNMKDTLLYMENEN